MGGTREESSGETVEGHRSQASHADSLSEVAAVVSRRRQAVQRLLMAAGDGRGNGLLIGFPCFHGRHYAAASVSGCGVRSVFWGRCRLVSLELQPLISLWVRVVRESGA